MIPGEFRTEFFEELQECFADADRENNFRRKKVIVRRIFQELLLEFRSEKLHHYICIHSVSEYKKRYIRNYTQIYSLAL